MTVYTHSSSDQNPNSSSSSHFNQIKSSNQTISPIQPQISMKPVSLSSNNPQAQNLTLYSPVRRLILDRILKEKKKRLRAILSMACNPSHGLTTINIGPTPSCSDLAQMKTANKFLGEGKEVGWTYMDFQFLSLEIQPKCHHLGSLWSKGWFEVQFIFDDLEDHIWSTRFLVVHIEIGSRRGGNFCQAKSPDVTILWVWGRGLLWS